jgi:apolipoprotein N-acyltransferase
LVPYGEYLPARPLLETIGLSRLAPGSLDFWPGPGPRTLVLDGLPPVGPLICYEVIFPGRVTDHAKRPAWLLNISNDAWFGRSHGPAQHFAQAQMRAIEEGLPVVRVTPTGMTGVIDPYGRVRDLAATHSASVLTVELPQPRAATLFARWGQLTTLLLLGLLAGLALMLEQAQKWSRRARDE